jgi:hypothetical protein
MIRGDLVSCLRLPLDDSYNDYVAILSDWILTFYAKSDDCSLGAVTKSAL